MRLAFIYPPFYHKKFNENLPTTDDEFGLFPHLGFGWVAAAAKTTGASMKLFDAAAVKYTYDSMLRDVRAFNPDLLCFSAHSLQTFRDMLLWAKNFKRDTGLPALVGGHEAKTYPFEIMSHDAFDFLCAGEAMTFIPPFLQALEKGSGYADVPDLVHRDGGELRRTLDAEFFPFARHPHPDRSIFPNERYYSHVSQRKNFTIGMSSVGCPYPCTFCSIRQTGFDVRHPEQVADEMQECIEKHGIHEIDFFDPIMLFDRDRAIGIAREIRRRKLDIIWSTRARVDSVESKSRPGEPDEEFIRELAESGCRRLFFGIESGDDEILRNVKKGEKTGDMKKVLDCVAAHGIRPLGFFMIGNPGETEQTVDKTIRLARALPLDYVQFTLTMIKPHSDLEQKFVVESTGMNYWREYILGNVEERILPTPWTQLTRSDLERLTKRAYLQFYLRPSYMWKMIRKIESAQELLRYARVAMQMIFRPLRPETNGGMSLPKKAWRFVSAFVDGALAASHKGARHPVAFFGGGLRGAYRFAKYEWRRCDTGLELAAPGSVDEMLLSPDAHTRISNIQTFEGPNRYVPITKGALGCQPFKNGTNTSA
jgi:anaerobic magnesium-protoporphyrin IX monomethyl ester cyclase